MGAEQASFESLDPLLRQSSFHLVLQGFGKVRNHVERFARRPPSETRRSAGDFAACSPLA
ncbi:hypothetical protein [Enorma sp.]|jgi:hypothetical protein|uniref:hypothetical protein n=1 Tax=Enorma sp. TaxID=1920692 RepID=UPI003AB891F0